MKKNYQKPYTEQVTVQLFGSVLNPGKVNLYNGTVTANTMDTFAKGQQFWDDEEDETLFAKPRQTNIWFDEEDDEE